MKNNSLAHAFAATFSLEEWQTCLADAGFAAAVDREDFTTARALASVIYAEKTNASLSADGQSVAAAIATREATHAAACALISRWAAAVGATGGRCAQIRQSKRRKLLKNGLASPYAARLKAEAGIA